MPRADWLKMLAIRYAALPDPAIVGGIVLNALPDNPYATASQLIVDVGHAYHNSDPNKARFFTTSNLAVPADRFRELGGFDESFGTTASEDRELCGRWQHSGYRMVYAPEAVVEHAHTLTWRTFIRQHFGYGRGAVRLQRARARQGWQVFSPDPRYYRALLRAPFARFPFREAVGVAALLFVSQTITMAGMASEWFRRRREPLICTGDA
jgi:GT2 family glycosyltransferase